MSEADLFDRDDPATPGRPEEVLPGVRRLLAPNPSPMTFTGTSTWIVGALELAVIDPGPDDPSHLDALLKAIGGARLRAILVTHSHLDHSALAPRLAAATGAPLLAYGPHGAGMSREMQALARSGAEIGGGEGADRAFQPERRLDEGDAVEGEGWRLTALRTPGHLSNHLAFALEGRGALFTGDAVMAWSTTLVSPPEGDMAAQMDTLRRLLARDDRIYLPGHGPPAREPARLIAAQLAHREARETAVLDALGAGPATAAEVAARVYQGLDPRLLPAARRNAFAHLIALEAVGRVATDGVGTPPDNMSTGTRFRLA